MPADFDFPLGDQRARAERAGKREAGILQVHDGQVPERVEDRVGGAQRERAAGHRGE